VWGGYRKGKNNSWLTFLYFLKGLIAGYSQGYRKGYRKGKRSLFDILKRILEKL